MVGDGEAGKGVEDKTTCPSCLPPWEGENQFLLSFGQNLVMWPHLRNVAFSLLC